MSASLLEQLQADVFGRLSADPYFANIGVFQMRPRGQLGFVQIQTRIDQFLNCLEKKAGLGGAAVTVLMPLADSPDANIPGPALNVTLVVRVQELPVVNMGSTGTQKSCESIALYVAQLLHQFNPGAGGVLVAARDVISPSAEFDPRITIDVKFIRQTGLPRLVKVAAPSITPNSGAHSQSLTLACTTGGAAIYYTSDGSYPSSVNPTATLYTAPFTPGAAGTIRAAAELANYQQSDATSATFT